MENLASLHRSHLVLDRITECIMTRDSLVLGSLSKLLTPFRQ